MAHNPKQYYTDNIRYLDKGISVNERENYYNWLDEQIKMFGQEVTYYTLNFQLSAHDQVYGEMPDASYSTGQTVVMMIELTEQSIMLGQFGLEAEDEVTAYVAISAFKSKFPTVEEPKSGDVFTLTEYGDDRPGNRGGKSFEITERIDQEVSTMNPLMGHYVWQIKAKRLDYSFEPGIDPEKGANQLTDSLSAGRLPGYTNPEVSVKSPEVSASDIDIESKKIFDYTQHGDDDDVYGDYY